MAKKPSSPKPSAELLVAQLKDLLVLHRNRLAIQAQRVLRLEQANKVSFPEDAENPQQVLSGTLGDQLDLWKGLFQERPSVVLPVEESESKAEKERLQAIQDYANGLPWLLERQGRPVLGPCTDDLGLHGYAIWRCDVDLPEMANQMPNREDYESADDYTKARDKKLQAMGSNTGRSPLSWSRVPVQFFFWLERADRPGLELACEIRLRKLGPFLADERYQRKMPKLRANYKQLLANDPTAAARSWVPVVFVEDGAWCSTIALTDCLTTTDTLQDLSTLAERIVAKAQDGEVADQYAALLDRPQYVLVDGLTTNSTDPGMAKVGIGDRMSGLIDRFDTILSWRLTEYGNFGAFPPVVTVQDIVRDQYGNPLVSAEDDAGTPDVGLNLKPGFHKVTEMRPGQKFQFVRPEGMTPDAAQLQVDIRHLIGLKGIPDNLYGSQGAKGSGYQANQEINTVHSRYKPQVTNICRGWIETIQLFLELTRIAYKGERARIATPGPKASDITWVSLNPDKDLADLSMPMEAVFEFKNPTDELSQLQAYHLATDEPNPALTENEGRQRFLKLDNPESMAQQLLVQRYKRSPQLEGAVLNAALQKFDKKLAALQAQQQGAFSTADLQGATPAVAQTISRMAQPGMPGYGAVQRFQQQGQPGTQGQPIQPPQPAPQAQQGPQIKGPAALPGGRPAGNRVRPGGPRKTGGL